MKISVSSYSFLKHIKEGKMTAMEVVKYAHELGFDAIEFAEVVGETYEEKAENAKFFRAQADKYGIDVAALAVSGNLYQETKEESDAEIERLRGQLELARILGAPVMRHDIVWQLKREGTMRSFDLMLPVIAGNVRRVTEIASEMGIKTCTENHGYISQDSDRIERLIAAVNHDNFGALVDMGNFSCADDDNALAVSRLANLAFHVHAKDFHKRSFEEGPAEGYFQTRACNYLKGCTIGDGDVPVAQCIAILKRAGYDGYITVEYEGYEDCLEGIKRGREYIAKHI
ncbi:MAG: sugar phosphate isomerase/epimerase [Clostridia bacterium]|nr:sugar phosphate isomerase/epimerase [Clostridia bacterium]